MERPFNEQGFRKAASQAGFSEEEINSAIQRRMAKENLYGKLATSNLLPWLLGVPAAIGGLALGGPPGAGIGAFAGVAAGEATKDALQRTMGLKKEQELESIGEVAHQASIAGTGAYGLSSLAQLLGMTAKPIQTLSAERERAIKKLPKEKQTIPRSLVEEKLWEIPRKKFRGTEEVAEAERKITNYLADLFQWKPAKGGIYERMNIPERISIKELLDYVKEVPYDTKLNKAVSNVLREQINLSSPAVSRTSNLMHRLYQAKPYATMMLKSAARGLPWALGLGYILDKARGLFRGEGD